MRKILSFLNVRKQKSRQNHCQDFWLNLFYFICTYHLHPQSGLSSNAHLSGGKNSSTGKQIRSNRSHGESSVEPTHSLSGTQKSYAGINSCTLRSSLMIEKIPSDTYTLFSSPSSMADYKRECCVVELVYVIIHQGDGVVKDKYLLIEKLNLQKKIHTPRQYKSYLL